MFISFLSLAPIFIAVFLFSLWRPKVAIFLPIVFHLSFLVKTRLFFMPSTGLELMIVGVLLGVWMGCCSPLIRGVRGVFFQTNCQTPFRSPLSRGNLRRIISTEHFVTVFLVFLFVLSATISAIIAPHFTTAWGEWKAFVAEPILYAVTLIFFVKRYKLESRFIAALLGGGLVSCLFSLVFWHLGADFWRFRGIYDVPNSLALILAPLLVIAVLVFLENMTLSVASAKKQRLFLGIIMCVFGFLLLATQSIAGIISVGVSLTIIIFIRKKLNRRIVIGLFLLIMFAVGAQIFSGKIPHLFNPTSSSFIAREQIWTVAVALIKDHPLLGTGLGTFEPAYQEKLKILNTNFGSSGVLEWVVRDPHNIVLSFWLNSGLLGLLSMSGLVVIGFKKAFGVVNTRGSEDLSYSPLIRGIKWVWRRVAAKTPPRPLLWVSDVGLPLSGEESQFRLIASIAILTLVIFGLFDVPYWKNDLALLWWVYLLGAIL